MLMPGELLAEYDEMVLMRVLFYNSIAYRVNLQEREQKQISLKILMSGVYTSLYCQLHYPGMLWQYHC